MSERPSDRRAEAGPSASHGPARELSDSLLLRDRLRLGLTSRKLREDPALVGGYRLKTFAGIDVRTLLALFAQQHGARARRFRIEINEAGQVEVILAEQGASDGPTPRPGQPVIDI